MPGKKLKYGEYRKQGRCVRCYRENPTPEKPFCPTCDEKVKVERREIYHYYKENKICVRCHKEPAARGKTRCLNCADIENYEQMVKRKPPTEEQKQRRKELNEARRQERISKGICAKCGKRPITKGSTVMCIECLLKNRRRNKKYFELQRTYVPKDQRKALGLCYKCGKPFEPNGTAYCNDCREAQRQVALHQNHDNWKRHHIEQNRLLFCRKGKG